jgi:TonB family protein
VKLAAKVDVVAGKKTSADRSSADRSSADRPSNDRSPLLADFADKVGDQFSANASVPHAEPDSQSELHADSPLTGSSAPDSHSGEAASSEPPSISVTVTNPSSLNTVLSTKPSLPGSAPVSTGVSGGQVVRRVEPDYPLPARKLRLQGTVVLAVMVMEDGTVGEVKVVEGPPGLAPSAVDAIKQWRYKPYELDGKPVKNQITVNVDFKFTEPNH